MSFTKSISKFVDDTLIDLGKIKIRFNGMFSFYSLATYKNY